MRIITADTCVAIDNSQHSNIEWLVATIDTTTRSKITTSGHNGGHLTRFDFLFFFV